MTNRLPHLDTRIRTRTAVAAAVAVGLVTLAGCGAGSSDSTVSGAAGGGSAGIAKAPPAANAAEPAGSAVDAYGTQSPRSAAAHGADQALLLTERAVIRTGAIDLHSDDVADTIGKVEGVVLTSGGDIASENTETDKHGSITDAKLQVEVPVAQFQSSVDSISGYATLVSKQTSAQDVTTQVADVNSRVQSAKDSIAQLQTLYTRAHTLGQVIALERELSQREANLESLQAQQRALAAQTTMSTILVTIEQASGRGRAEAGQRPPGRASCRASARAGMRW